MCARISRFLFLITLFLLPTQLGKHFWPEFSYISGIRVDYLSPTFYFTDLLIIMLAVLEIKKIYKFIKSSISIKSSAAGMFILIFLFINIVYSGNPAVSLLKTGRFLEYSIFILMIWFNLKNNKAFGFFAALSFGALFQSMLAICQFISQSSLNGIFWYLGERSFNAATPLIALTEILDGIYIRPYGTFSHPNVLAGYLAAVTLMTFGFLADHKDRIERREKLFYSATTLFSVIAIFLTFSRTGWLYLTISTFVFFLLSNMRDKLKYILGVGIGILILFKTALFGIVSQRFTSLFYEDSKSLLTRFSLNEAAWKMFVEHPWFGVGFNNFIISLPGYLRQTGELQSYQPVHNIYLLLLSESGIFGLGIFLCIVALTVINLTKNKNLILKNSHLLIILTGLLITGMFDHYLLTLPQGQLLLAVVLGTCWVSKNKAEARHMRIDA